jgi:NAD(P)-dependent dehydrogenase (short-subunit alcohol dehydrogenase family)
MDEIRFDGRVALVTGAGNGVGRAHALLLASRGAKVVVNDLGGSVDGEGASTGPAQVVVDEITDAGGEAIANPDSVTDEHGAQRMVRAALDTWGRLDIVVNNAGVLDTAEFTSVDEAYDRRVIGTHLQGTINVTRAAWPHLVAQGYGRVVSTSSGAVFGSPVGLSYQSAKAGVIGLTRGLATAGTAHGIAVNAIMPTAFTRMTDSIPDPAFREFMETRFTPERIAGFVAVLAHETCGHSGEVFLVGGGRISRVLLGVTAGIVADEGTPEEFALRLDEAMRLDGVIYPRDRLEEFQSYLGRLGFGSGSLDMGGLVRKEDSR